MSDSKIPDISVAGWRDRHGLPTRSSAQSPQPAKAAPKHQFQNLVPLEKLHSREFLASLQHDVREREARARTGNLLRPDTKLVDEISRLIKELDQLQLNVLMLTEQGLGSLEVGREIDASESQLQMAFASIYRKLGMDHGARKVGPKLKRVTLHAAWRKYVLSQRAK